MKRSYEMDLCSGPLLSKILLFSLPLILSGVLQLLFNATDIVVVGKFAGSNAMAAVGSTTSLFNLLVNSFIGISVGANVLVARHYGERDYDGVQQTIQTALLTGLIGGTILIVLGVVLARPMLTLMATPDEVIDQAVLYMQVYFIGMPATMIYNFGAAVLRAVGDTRRPLYFLMAAGVMNVLGDLLFVCLLGMGVAGTAIATVLSQTVSAVWVLAFLLSGRSTLRIRRKNLRFSAPVLASVAALGVSPFIMQSTESLVTITLNRGMAQYGGELYMGTITILQSVMQLIVLPLQGLTQGTQPIISYSYGAKNLDRVSATFKRVFLISMIYTISAFALVCLLAWPLSRMFTSDAALIDLTVKAMPVFFGGIWAFGAQMSCQAAFMGLGQAKVSLFLALLRKVILLIPLAIVLPMVMGGDPFAIYLAEPASDFIASATTLTIFLMLYKRTLNRPAD